MLSLAVATQEPNDGNGAAARDPSQSNPAHQPCGERAAQNGGMADLSPKTPSLNEMSLAPGSSAKPGPSETLNRAMFSFLAKATNTGTLGPEALRQKPETPELGLRNMVSETRNRSRSSSSKGVMKRSSFASGSGDYSLVPRGLSSSDPDFHKSFDSLPELAAGANWSQPTGSTERLEREAVEAICKLAVANLALVHSLQAERGSSAIYVASSTQMMSDKIQLYRQRTDALLEVLPPPGSEVETLEISDYIKALERVRTTVDHRSCSYLEVLVSYTWVVDSLLDMLTQAIEPVRKTAVGPSVASLLLVQRIKECSALQRGTVGGVLASGILRMQREVYWSLVKNLARMEAFEGVFRLLADTDTLNTFMENASNMPPLINEFQTRLEESKEMVEGMLITTNVDIWFRQSSEWIGLLDNIQNMLIERIQTLARQICQDEALLLSLYSYKMESSMEGSMEDTGHAPRIGNQESDDDDDGTHYSRQLARLPGASANPILKQCNISMEDLEFGEELGRGSSGQTYLAEWQGNKVAVKVFEGGLNNQKSGHGYLRTFCQEVKVLGQLHHPNICAFYGASLSFPKCCIITEHMDRGCLWSQLHKNGGTDIDFMTTATQIASGLGYLHNVAGLVHRDMKTPNVLMDHTGKVKIADFGLTTVGSQIYDDGRRVGTLRWMAPEVMHREVCSFRSDIYSMGIMLWELLTKDIPFKACDIQSRAFIQACSDGVRPVIPKGTPQPIAELILCCVHPEPANRPSASDALKMLRRAHHLLSFQDIEFLNSPHPSEKLAHHSSCWEGATAGFQG